MTSAVDQGDVVDLDLVIRNGTLVTSAGIYQADVGVSGEQIAAIGQELRGKRAIDATGMLVTPGAVDMHVHLEMPIGNFVSSDDFFTGTRAAAYGGTTTIVDFVEPRPEQSMADALAARRSLADPKVVVDYGLHMTIGPAEIDKLDQVSGAFDAGCKSFKLYMAYAMRLNDGQLLQAFEAIRAANGLPVVHAENWEVISTLVARNLAAGKRAPRWHPRSRPAVMEAEAVGRVIDIATLADTRVHIFHVSCPEAAEVVGSARTRGLPVTAETCPQYLLLTQELFDRPGVAGALPVCSPPIRDQASQDGLWRALADDSLQVISTDHCPFTSAEKASGLEDYSRIPGGVPSIEMRFAAMYSQGVRAGHITLGQWVDQCCSTPAQLAGLKGKGELRVGYDADLVIFDPEKRVTLSQPSLHEQVDWTPYEGIELQGWPDVTISRGEIIVENGRFLGQAGRGRFAARDFPP